MIIYRQRCIHAFSASITIKEKSMNEFEKLIEAAESICILGHTNPDGDCLGSTLGTKLYIQERYPDKKVNVYLQPANEKFRFMPGFDDIIHVPSDRKYRLCIICDCNGYDRVGDFKVLAEHADNIYVVDHHIPGNQKFEKCTIIPEASSTCEVVYDLMDDSYVTKDAASCLYLGMVHDTGVFKYNCTSRHTMELAGQLMSKGIDFGSIIDDTYYTKTYAQQQVLGRVLTESLMIMDKRCIAGWLTCKDMRFYNVTSKDIDGIVSTMRETRGVDCAVFIYEMTNQNYKVSLRSNNNMLDVAKVASHFGGGGHKMAAGCSLQGSHFDVINNITKELSKQLDAPGFISNSAQ